MTRTLVATLTLCLSASAQDPAPAPRPHIVVLLADDLGWADVGFHGSQIKTPHIDALAKRGTRLEQFYVQPVCSPTRGALLTGRYPMRLGLQVGVVRPWARHGLPLDEQTLPEVLQTAGYATAICGKWHLGHSTREYLPTHRGFERQYGHYNGALDYFTHVRDGGHDWHQQDRANYDQGYATDLIADAAIEVLAEHDPSKPLFLYVPFNAPHTPLQAPRAQIEKYAHITDRRRRIYAAMVGSLDDAIGRIVAALEQHRFDPQNTLLFFCSDNGGMNQFGSNGPLRGQKGRLYEGGIRVPAVACWPGKIAAGATVDTPLHVVDLFPTLARLAGATLRMSKPLDGRDAWPAIAEGAESPHELIVHNVTPWSGAIRVGDWKLVHNGGVPANARKGPKRERLEMFDLAKDPGEQNNIAAEHPEVFDELEAKLEALRAEAAKPNIPPNQAPAGFRSPKVWGEADGG